MIVDQEPLLFLRLQVSLLWYPCPQCISHVYYNYQALVYNNVIINLIFGRVSQ